MQRLAGVLLEMQPLDADPHGAIGHIDRNFALPHQRRLVLADLVALRQVRTEIILPVEYRTQVDLGFEAEPGAHGLGNAFLVYHRQHPRHRGVDERYVGVRLAPECGGGAGEQLCVRLDLSVDFQPDDDFPVAGRTFDELRGRGLHVHGGPVDVSPFQALRAAPAASRGSADPSARLLSGTYALSLTGRREP